MKTNNEINEHAARVADILEQIQELNKMIIFHKVNSTDDSMQTQYEYMKKEFLDELTKLFVSFKLDVKIKDIAV
ncbi:MAG: hypothetical protein IIA88_02595 [Bacteroidetes bacterium]|nr:hypothetical protein [Bacteroidota bacterium]